MTYGEHYGLHAERVSENPESPMTSSPTFEHWMEDYRDRMEDQGHAKEMVEMKVGGGVDLPDFVPIEDPLWRLHFPR